MDARSERLAAAQDLLRELNFDAERCNERSGLVLLALLDLTPDTPWSAAGDPMRRTVEIIDWLREHYGKDYKPNTRETIRRQTLHQFVDAGLVILNPDEPTRPVNSPRSCYQIEALAFSLIRRQDDPGYSEQLTAYLTDRPGLVARNARERHQDMIPVVLPNGRSFELTPGGQNILLKLMVEEFCPRWTPGGRILYVGDAGKHDPVFDETRTDRSTRNATESS